jgi:hypothetical protein
MEEFCMETKRGEGIGFTWDRRILHGTGGAERGKALSTQAIETVLISSSLADPAATEHLYTKATKIFAKYWKYLFFI